MATSDKVHLQFIYDRLVYHHGENPNYDYILRLKEIIDGPPREPRPAPSTNRNIMRLTKEHLEALEKAVARQGKAFDIIPPDFATSAAKSEEAIAVLKQVFGGSSTDYITLYPTIG